MSAAQRGPHSLEAEESVIGGILVRAAQFGQVAEFLRPEHFHHTTLAQIFQAMVALDSASRPIDPLTVVEQLKISETFHALNAYGGANYLTELMAKVVTVENIAYHAKIVHSKAIARRVVSSCQEIAAKGCGEYGEVDDFLEAAEQSFYGATQSALRVSYEHVKGILHEAVIAIGKRYEQKKAITGVPTGFAYIDQMTAGLQPGELIIIAARPSMGKTSWAMDVVLNAAIEHKIPNIVFSLEMSKDSLVQRFIASRARVDASALKSGQLSTLDFVNMSKALAAIATAPIFIDDSGAPTLMEIRSKCRKWRADKNIFSNPKEQLGMVVIDYLQLVQAKSNKEDNRQREVAELARGFKALAKELGCPVVVLSQLNRNLESRADKRPLLSDLRESGAVEQDADVVAFLYRDEYYSKDDCAEEDRGVAEFIIGKQRNGPTGVARLAWLSAYTLFQDIRDSRNYVPRPNGHAVSPHETDNDRSSP